MLAIFSVTLATETTKPCVPCPASVVSPVDPNALSGRKLFKLDLGSIMEHLLNNEGGCNECQARPAARPAPPSVMAQPVPLPPVAAPVAVPQQMPMYAPGPMMPYPMWPQQSPTIIVKQQANSPSQQAQVEPNHYGPSNMAGPMAEFPMDMHGYPMGPGWPGQGYPYGPMPYNG
ncbi:hypothetical protein HDE_09249 [Halotydeus destructor]|nr:hypothetical protein HDE_09249 [Halotydeus destructor]